MYLRIVLRSSSSRRMIAETDGPHRCKLPIMSNSSEISTSTSRRVLPWTRWNSVLYPIAGGKLLLTLLGNVARTSTDEHTSHFSGYSRLSEFGLVLLGQVFRMPFLTQENQRGIGQGAQEYHPSDSIQSRMELSSEQEAKVSHVGPAVPPPIQLRTRPAIGETCVR